MSRQRRTFTPESKREAASLVLDVSYTRADAAQPLVLVKSALRRWVNQLQHKQGGVMPTAKPCNAGRLFKVAAGSSSAEPC